MKHYKLLSDIVNITLPLCSSPSSNEKKEKRESLRFRKMKSTLRAEGKSVLAQIYTTQTESGATIKAKSALKFQKLYSWRRLLYSLYITFHFLVLWLYLGYLLFKTNATEWKWFLFVRVGEAHRAQQMPDIFGVVKLAYDLFWWRKNCSDILWIYWGKLRFLTWLYWNEVSILLWYKNI